jgi:hypothetical protein
MHEPKNIGGGKSKQSQDVDYAVRMDMVKEALNIKEED